MSWPVSEGLRDFITGYRYVVNSDDDKKMQSEDEIEFIFYCSNFDKLLLSILSQNKIKPQ